MEDEGQFEMDLYYMEEYVPDEYIDVDAMPESPVRPKRPISPHATLMKQIDERASSEKKQKPDLIKVPYEAQTAATTLLELHDTHADLLDPDMVRKLAIIMAHAHDFWDTNPLVMISCTVELSSSKIRVRCCDVQPVSVYLAALASQVVFQLPGSTSIRVDAMDVEYCNIQRGDDQDVNRYQPIGLDTLVSKDAKDRSEKYVESLGGIECTQVVDPFWIDEHSKKVKGLLLQ